MMATNIRKEMYDSKRGPTKESVKRRTILHIPALLHVEDMHYSHTNGKMKIEWTDRLCRRSTHNMHCRSKVR